MSKKLAPLGSAKAMARSRLTNGSALLTDCDGRGAWARRFRDIMALHTMDRGGLEAISAAEVSIIRRVATIEVELEILESKFANAGGADAATLELYGRTANSLRRMLESVGIKRAQRDITPSLDSYLAAVKPAIEPNE